MTTGKVVILSALTTVVGAILTKRLGTKVPGF